jgi:prolyl 4-hydroxylase
VSGAGGKVDGVRTSSGMFILGQDAFAEANLRMRTVTAAVTGVNPLNIEATQVLHYRPGERYLAHPDWFGAGSKEHLARGGQRFSTILCWLNNVAAGGYTSFPYAKVAVKPKPGSCVLFYSMDREGQIDTFATHGAEPPEPGSEKWVAVDWIRQHEFH